MLREGRFKETALKTSSSLLGSFLRKKNLRRRCSHEMFHGVEGLSSLPSSSSFGCSTSVGLFGVRMRPVRGSTGRVSRWPPLRPIATIGGGGSKPALKRICWTGSEGWAPTDSQYLQRRWTELVGAD